MENRPIQIAIDGPVGAGKGTVAHILRLKIGGFDLYTGGTYRAVALYCLRHGIDVTDEAGVVRELPNMQVNVVNETIYLNGEDVTEEIKKSEVANATPKVACIRQVRDAMIAVQRKGVEKAIHEGKSIIVEGRDIGTNVIPNADLKVFLTADPDTRTRRRMNQLDSFGEHIDYEKVRREVDERDKQDYERENDPLEKHPEDKGYFVIDNSNQSEEQTANIIVDELRNRNLL